MLYLAFALAVLLMYRTGLFDEYLDYRQLREHDGSVMIAADEAIWEDRMDRFRRTHPALQNRSWMRLG
ncbi:MAG: hypothetical protein HKN17_05330 [Rhodothermales bacterium]|nr:hypothetical protein [Rhodothermales bacterium]